MKSLVDLQLAVLADASANSLVANQPMDAKTIASRVEHEGLSFLTITLPDLGKTFDRSLEAGVWLIAPAFARRRGESLPAFLQGLTGRVFDVVSGKILRNPSIEAIEGIRQVCRLYHKVKMECTHERRFNAEQKFMECEEELSDIRPSSWIDKKAFKLACRILYGNVLNALNEELGALELMPRHGPGTTEDGTRGDAKYHHCRWSKRLDRWFPISDYISVNYGEWSTRDWDHLEMLSKGQEPPVKVVFVPKTLRTPRVIAIEPVYAQYAQQAISRRLVSLLENDNLVRGSIHFTDQTVNATIALESSRTREFATLDLSEASDRVHAALVTWMLSDFRHLMKASFACRSANAKLPSGKVIPLRKFASMGSALCFPFEAMVFLGMAVVAALKTEGVKPTVARIKRVLRKIHVYGDDITVQNKNLGETISVLESAGLKVNRQKTFSAGHFRESCGTDAYMGTLVTPVYVRTLAPRDRCDGSSVSSWISLGNQLYAKGYWRSCSFVRSLVERTVGVVPHVTKKSPIMGWHSMLDHSTIHMWDVALQQFKVRGFAMYSKRHASKIEGRELLLKWFLTRGKEPLEDSVTEFTLPYESVMKRRWAPALR